MKKARGDGGRRESFVDVGLEVQRVIEKSKELAAEAVREAQEEAALTLSQARHEAERITEEATENARETEASISQARAEADRIIEEANERAKETIEVLLMTAQAQREEMLEDQSRRTKMVREYDKELREQITVLQHELAKLKGETPALVPEATFEEEEEQADASIWTDSEKTGKSPRPVPIHDIGA